MRRITGAINLGTGSVLEVLRANRIVSAKIGCLEKSCPASTYSDDKRLALPEDVLRRQLEEEGTRRETIEDKAKTNVLGITLGFSAMFAGVALVSPTAAAGEPSTGWQGCALLVLLFIGGLFLLVGGAHGTNRPPHCQVLYLVARGRSGGHCC